MQETITQPSAASAGGQKDNRLSHLNRIVDHAGDLLPISGPITAFAFLNTLQALEDLPFDEGMRKGARLYGCHPYLPEERYREKLARERIRIDDLRVVLREELGESADETIDSLAPRIDIRSAMLQYPLHGGPTEELRWFVMETDALKRLRPEAPAIVRDRFIEETRHWVMRDVRDGRRHNHQQAGGPRDLRAHKMLADVLEHFGEASIEEWSDHTWEQVSLQALWRICRDGVHGLKSFTSPPPLPLRQRDLLLEATGEDSDALVHSLLIRFCAAFTDQGFAHWPLPHRDQGFFKAFCDVYGQSGGPPDRWMAKLPQEIARIKAEGLSAQASILESLELLGVEEYEWDDFIPATLIALRGWAGMIRHMEVRPDRVPVPVLPGTLAEFLAVRLILERLALEYVAEHKLHYNGPLNQLREVARRRIAKRQPMTVEQRAFVIFQLAQVLGWCPPVLYRLTKKDWSQLMEDIEAFNGLERRRVFQLAFERRFRTNALDALSVYTRRQVSRPEKPRFQAAFCIDAREESFRRHLEEFAPDVETFSLAGFFCVAMYYRGLTDAHYAALCPIVVRPQHWVVEDVVYTLEESHRRRAATRRAIGAASHQLHRGSRNLAGGAILTAGLGVLASVPLLARVLFPRLTSQIRKTAGRFVQPPPISRLRLERRAPEPGMEDDAIGFTVEEMANISERVLRDIGLTNSFARLVLFMGHGSFCLNNPHKSAYDCGACTGNAGSPNARALAVMLNDVRVREILSKHGLPIPTDTVFLGGLHNTCDDSVSFLDLDLLPKSHFADYESARATLEEVCQRNAHERCRRFETAPLDISAYAAHRHVEARSEDLAQTRPEYGNATNAMCIVGRRERTRGLYMDRRSFLHSYNPLEDDDDASILGRILTPVIPVCEGINMTYFLSYTDSPGWACGTKLPHNVTSLLGVMDGHASDLRPGLPWQSVEIHEPLRCLFVIETTPEKMVKIMDRIEVVGKILRNGWAQLALLDPHSSQIRVFRNNEFHLYQPSSAELAKSPTSVDWYRGWRDHLPFAAIED